MGPRRVDVHAKGAPPRVVPGGGTLEAPGILANPLPVDALFDEARANEVAFRNLLAKYGHESVEAIRGSGREEGRASALRRAVEALSTVLSIELDEARRAAINAMGADALDALVAHLTAHRAWP